MKLRFTPRATQDLAEIADYIHAHNPAAAQNVRAAILHSLQNLVLFPEVGQRQAVEGVRKLVTRKYPYLVYYTVDQAAEESCDPHPSASRARARARGCVRRQCRNAAAMFAKRLEGFLAHEAAKTDLAQRARDDMPQRFESLRGSGLLPRGRGKNAKPLSNREIVAGVLSTVTVKPGYAGIVAILLKNLRPVGGSEASFRRSAIFGDAVEALIDDPGALDSLIAVRVSDSGSHERLALRAGKARSGCRTRVRLRKSGIDLEGAQVLAALPANRDEGHETGLRQRVAPAMAGSVLHDAIALA
jgi:plasmid stabilization system protein ParE